MATAKQPSSEDVGVEREIREFFKKDGIGAVLELIHADGKVDNPLTKSTIGVSSFNAPGKRVIKAINNLLKNQENNVDVQLAVSELIISTKDSSQAIKNTIKRVTSGISIYKPVIVGTYGDSKIIKSEQTLKRRYGAGAGAGAGAVSPPSKVESERKASVAETGEEAGTTFGVNEEEPVLDPIHSGTQTAPVRTGTGETQTAPVRTGTGETQTAPVRTTSIVPTASRAVPASIRAIRSVPEATQAVPLTTTSVPEATQAVPLTVGAVPEATQAVPLTTTSVPEATQAVALTVEAVPEATQAVALTVEAVPEATEVVPIQADVPEQAQIVPQVGQPPAEIAEHKFGTAEFAERYNFSRVIHRSAVEQMLTTTNYSLFREYMGVSHPDMVRIHSVLELDKGVMINEMNAWTALLGGMIQISKPFSSASSSQSYVSFEFQEVRQCALAYLFKNINILYDRPSKSDARLDKLRSFIQSQVSGAGDIVQPAPLLQSEPFAIPQTVGASMDVMVSRDPWAPSTSSGVTIRF